MRWGPRLAKGWGTTNLDRPSPFPLRFSGSLLLSEAGRWAACFGALIEFGRLACLLNRDVAAGVAAQAEDLQFVPDALAVVATELLLFLGEASAGHIRAFLRIRRKTQHNPPLPIRSAPF